MAEVAGFMREACGTDWNAEPWRAAAWFESSTTLRSEAVEGVLCSCLSVGVEWGRCKAVGSSKNVFRSLEFEK